MRLFRKMAAISLAVVMVVLTCSGCSSSQNKMQQIQESGKLVMYTNAAFPPYEFLGANGEITGVDVEIGRAIADELGVTLEVNNANFDGIVSAIASGKGDVGIAGITITDERSQRVDFSEPYIESVQYVILPQGSDIQVLEDLSAKTVGAQTGTTGYLYLDDQNRSGLMTEQPCNLLAYQTPTDAMVALSEGKLDAVVVDQLVAEQLAKSQPNFTAIPLITASGEQVKEECGVAVAKGNEDLLAVINQVIEQMKSDGSIDQYFVEYSELVEQSNGNGV